MKIHSIVVAIGIVCLPLASLIAQNPGSVGKEKSLKITGGVSLNQLPRCIDSRLNPHVYYASIVDHTTVSFGIIPRCSLGGNNRLCVFSSEKYSFLKIDRL